MKEDELIENFTDIIQPNIDDIKNMINSTNNKLFTLNSILFIIVLGALFLTNHFNLHIIFFIMTLFISVMISYLGNYTFNYEYHDILERTIFPKILNILVKDGSFTINTHLEEDAKNSDIFSIYEYFIASATIQSKWSIQFALNNRQIHISSTYIDLSDINNPAVPFSDKNKGLFITIENIDFCNSEIYIFENKLLHSMKEVSKILKKDLTNDNSLYDKFTVVSKTLNKESKNKIVQILNLFNQDVSITLRKNKMYIFVHKEFTCFDANYYTNGRIPSYFDYIELLKIKNSIEEVIAITKEV
ncbi:hypothetical protein [Sulfurospirillum sp. 1612]|uniref:hypothetical protein n=1 Tax=Sulfurospirillum sp. 1612 TaxID=3094835 RepID=UPI002F93DB52